ncbi:MAG: hypothetical protein QOE28_1779 [Solirubrobacteraceae bacterium]|jgi:hypothetical protein|nr:hypothetical protein [Solirubrobacteraceae bacterium]
MSAPTIHREATAQQSRAGRDVRDGTPFPIGGPTTASWRELALTKVAEMYLLADVLQRRRAAEQLDAGGELVASIQGHLDTARDAARRPADMPLRSRVRASIAGSDLARVATNLDAAEADLLRLAPPSYVKGQTPSLLAHVRQHLPAHDPRRQALEEIARGRSELDASQHDVLVAVTRAASSEARREVARVRSFRNVLLVTALVLLLLVGGLAVVGIAAPDAIPLCFTPGTSVVCPTHQAALGPGESAAAAAQRIASPWDLPLIELVGLMAAAVAGAVALRNVRGTSTPYSLPVALAVLKLPTGALTAVLGLLLMRGEFIPGLSALDFPAQIVAWAVVFGYAQQLLTRLVDQQAHTVLDDVGGSTAKAPAE